MARSRSLLRVFSIIPHLTAFVNSKFAQILRFTDPEICAFFSVDNFLLLLYNVFTR